MLRTSFLIPLALLVGCAAAPLARPVHPAIPELANPPPFPAFAKHPAGWPTLPNGSFGLPIMVFDPAIYVDEEGYHLFHTTPFCRGPRGLSFSWDPANPGACDIIDAPGSIAYAFSADRGQTWEHRITPVVLPSRSGFDSRKIETAHVVRIGDVLYLTYCADGAQIQRFQIGLATLALEGRSVRESLLDESRRFEKQERPLLPYDLRPGRFDNNVQEPSVVVHDDHLELFYIGLGLQRPEVAIDAPGQGITSVAMGRAELDLDWNVIERSDEPVMDWVNTSEVQYFDGRYHLFGSSLVHGEFHHQEEITYASSADGRSWSELTVLLSPEELPGWDNWGLMAPTAAVEADRVVLFYAANEVTRRRCFPVRRDGRFGLPVEGGSSCVHTSLGRAVSSRIPVPQSPPGN